MSSSLTAGRSPASSAARLNCSAKLVTAAPLDGALERVLAGKACPHARRLRHPVRQRRSPDRSGGRDIADPEVEEGWARVDVRAAALNHHDVWSLRGVGLKEEQLPMVLGCDAAGVDGQGNEVIVHSVVSSPDWLGDETLDPRRTLLSERHPGTLAERLAVPRRNLV